MLSIARVANAAVALGRGAIPKLARSRVVEFDQLHTAMAQASAVIVRSQALRTQAEGERESLLQDACKARRVAEKENRAKDQFLAMLGHAPTATAGLRLVAREKPDLAIVDIGLPDLTGYVLAGRLRGDAASQTMGLVALIGHGQKRDSENAVAAGFDFHLVKSADLSRLLEVIDLCGQAALLCKIATESADNPARVPRVTRDPRPPV